MDPYQVCLIMSFVTAWAYVPALFETQVHLFMAPDFEGTEPATKIKNRMAKLGEFFGEKDMDNILAVLPDFMYPTPGSAQSSFCCDAIYFRLRQLYHHRPQR